MRAVLYDDIEIVKLLHHSGKYKYTSSLFMVFNATCNNISVILRRSVLLVEETGVPEENLRPVTSH